MNYLTIRAANTMLAAVAVAAS